MSETVDALVCEAQGPSGAAPPGERELAAAAPRATASLIRMVTPCTTREDFAARLARHVHETGIFVATRRVVPRGLERPFVFQLANGTPVLEGRARVADVSPTNEAGRRRGMVLEFLEMPAASRALHREMLASCAGAERAAPPMPQPAPNGDAPPRPRRLARGTEPPELGEPRAPSSRFMQLANLLGEPAPGDRDETGPSEALPFDVSDAPAALALPVLAPARDAETAPPPTRARFPRPAIAAVALALGLAGGHAVGGGGESALAPVTIAVPVAPAPPAAPAASSPSLTAGGCTARIVATARGIAVAWNGQSLGATPLDGVAVPCGAAEVVLSHPRYQRAVRRIEARPGETASMTVEMERPVGRLTLRSRPAGATFTVDGVPVGTASKGVRVRAYSRVVVTAMLAGRRAWSKRVYVRGTSGSVVAELAPLPPRRDAGPRCR